WRLIYGLNLATGTPEEAAAEAAYVAGAVGPQLLAFQIGNEPDGFGRWSGGRPKTYDTTAFLDEWPRFHPAIPAAAPGAPPGRRLGRPRCGSRDRVDRAVCGRSGARPRDVDAALLRGRPGQQSGRDARKAHARCRSDRSDAGPDGSDRGGPSAAVADRRDELG